MLPLRFTGGLCVSSRAASVPSLLASSSRFHASSSHNQYPPSISLLMSIIILTAHFDLEAPLGLRFDNGGGRRGFEGLERF